MAQFLPTRTLGHWALPTQTHSNPNHHQLRYKLSRQHTTVQSPSYPPQYYGQNHQPIAIIESNTHDHFSFLYEKIINLQHKLDNTAGENGSAKRRKQVYWGKTRINQWLFTKNKDGHKQQNCPRPTKITILSRDDHQQYQQLQPARMIKRVKDNNSKEHFILHRYLCHHHKRNLQQQKQVE